MRRSLSMNIVLVSIIITGLLGGGVVYSATINPEKQTEKFLTAIQKKDFKTIFEMTYYYQMELAQIKSNNPKVLWQKLTTEYYESKKNALFSRKEESLADAWVRFGGALFGTPTDPVENIRVLMRLLTQSCKWRIIESKKEKHHDQWTGRQRDVNVVYVSLNYKTVEESPLIGSKALKEAILGFVLDGKTVLYMRSSKIGKGDVYWVGDPSIDLRVAQRLYDGRLYKEAIDLLEGLRTKKTLNQEGNKLLAAIYYEKVVEDCIDYRRDDKGKWFVFGVANEWEWNAGCKRNIDNAISLNEDLKVIWIRFLADSMKNHLVKKDFNNLAIEKMMAIAVKYSSGNAKLEEILYEPKLALSKIYINWAMHEKDYYFFFKHIDKAMTLLPDDLYTKSEILKVINSYLTNIMNMDEEKRRWKKEEIEKILEYVDKWKFNLEPDDRLLFSKAANYIASKYVRLLESFPRQKRYQERALHWKNKAEEWQTKTSAPLESIEKITIATLTKDIPDSDYFLEHSKVFNTSIVIVWPAVNRYFKAGRHLGSDKKITSDPDKGILLIEEIGGIGTLRKSISAVLVEEISENSTKVTVKTFCYEQKAFTEGWRKLSADSCSKADIEGIRKEIPGSSSLPKDAELQKLQAFITDLWKQVIQIPQPKRDWRELVALKLTGKYDDYSDLYLMGVNRRNLASNALVAANTFLTKKGDLKNAQKYAELATRHYIESNDLFKTSEMVFSGSVGMTAQVLEAIYRGSKEASKYGWYLMCGPKCYEVADYVFLMTDFAVDYGLEGMDEAKKNLIANAFVKTLLKTSGMSSWIENRTTHLIGDSGLYGVMDKTINSPEFQKAFMKVVAESGAYAAREMAETGAKTVISNSINFIKGSSNLKPGN